MSTWFQFNTLLSSPTLSMMDPSNKWELLLNKNSIAFGLVVNESVDIVAGRLYKTKLTDEYN